MFGRSRRTHGQPVAVTTTRTTRARPVHHKTGGGLMNRLRPRPNYTTSAAPVASTRTRRTHRKKHGLGATPRRNHHHAGSVTTTTTATTHPVVPARKASLGDKVSGAMLKLRGSLTGRPGLKGAGTRRMHGTDGRGTHRRYY